MSSILPFFVRCALFSLLPILVACSTVVQGFPKPPDPPVRPFEVIPGDPVSLSDQGMHTTIRDARGQEWLVSLKTDKGVGFKNLASGTTYIERWDGDKLTATLTTTRKVWTSTTWRGDRGLKNLQLREWNQRLDAATYIAASALVAADTNRSLSLSADANCADRNKEGCELIVGEYVDRGCIYAARQCAAAGGRLGPWGAGGGAVVCYLACKGFEKYGVGEACGVTADLICGTESGSETGCDPNNASCDGAGTESGSGNGAGDGTDGDVGNGEDNGTGDLDPWGQDSGSGNGAGDGTDGDVGNGEDNGTGDLDPWGEDSGSGNGAGDGTDGDVGNGEDNGTGDWQPPYDEEDWEPEGPGDWNGDGSPGNGGEAGSDYDDYGDYDPSGTDSGSGNGAGDGTDGDVGNGEDNGAGDDWTDPSGTDSGSGNGAGDGTDGDVGNGEDNGAGDWGECLCT